MTALSDQYSSQLFQQSVAEVARVMFAVILMRPEPPATELVVGKLVVSFDFAWTEKAESLVCIESLLVVITTDADVVLKVMTEDVSGLMPSPAAT